MKRLVATVPFLLLPALAWAQQYDSGDPTAAEQVVLESINRARSNPTAEGARLSAAAVTSNPSLVASLPGVTGIPGGDITEGLVAPNNVVGVRPPLAMNKILLGTARAHNTDMYNNNLFQHNSSGGVDPGTRMQNAGYTWMTSGGMSGENIAEAGSAGGGLVANADQLENILIIDGSVAGRGHRVNLLDTHAAPYFREIGIGYLHNDIPTASPLFMTDLVTEDFGLLDSAPGPFLLGVIYNDANGNNLYDVGEGISGIQVNILSGGTLKSAFAVSATAGGYVVPITGLSGTLTVQISGGSLTSAFSTDIGLSGENVKVDFIIKGSVASVAPSSVFPPVGGGSPSGGGGGGGGGGCGLLGLEGVLALALLRRRRG